MRRKMASVWGKRGAATRARNRLERGVDADTLRFWAADWARGLPVREIWSDGFVLRVVRSMRGRSGQFDVWLGANFWKTCGPRRLPAWLR